jgi:hypothetical protein
VCTRVDGDENGGVRQVEVEAERGGRCVCTVGEMRVQDPGPVENGTAPVGVGNTPDGSRGLNFELQCYGWGATRVRRLPN